MNKLKSIGISALNTFFIIIDVLLILTILFLSFAMILFFIGIICKGLNVGDVIINFISCVCKIKDGITMTEMIANFGVFTSATLVPIISYFVSEHKDNRNHKKRISEALAEANAVNFYIATMPYGIWEGLEESYYSYCLKEKKSIDECKALLDYNYILQLTFVGHFFQSYKISVLEVGYVTNFENGKRLNKPNVNRINIADSFTTDTTGTFCGPFVEGTSVVALVDEEDSCPRDFFLSPPSKDVNKNIYYEIHIEQRDESDFHPFKQMYTYCKNTLRFFPIIRLLCQKGIKHQQNLTAYRLELCVDPLPIATSSNKSKFQMSIYDLDIKTIRRSRRE